MPSNSLLHFPLKFTRFTRSHAVSLASALLAAAACLVPAGCAVSASANLSTAVQANQAATSTYTVAPAFFGMVVKTAATQPSIQTGSRRLWDSGVSWAALEPASGVYNWSVLDEEVSAAEAGGASVTLTLGMTPAWASSQPSLASAYGAGATAAPASLADWDAYVAAVAGRYPGRISAYEVWNTPEDATYWAGPSAQLGAQMAALAAHAATVIHAADPSAMVVAPALSPSGLQQFLSAGGGASVDALTLAPALDGEAPETTLTAVAAIRAVTTNTPAATKPLWNSQPLWTLPASAADPQTQAAFAARALILNASVGVQRLHWYAWDDTAPGSLRLTDDSGQATAAATAYGVVEGWLSSATMNGCASNAQSTWTCQVVRGGKPAWILWNPTQTVTSSSFGAATVTDLNGSVQPIAQGSIEVGASPVLLQ